MPRKDGKDLPPEVSNPPFFSRNNAWSFGGKVGLLGGGEIGFDVGKFLECVGESVVFGS